MKTIFITCFFNLAVRNILETSFFDQLRKKMDLRIVLLVPEKKGGFFSKEFGGPNVVVEEVPAVRLSKINLLFHWLSWNLLRTRSKKIHRIVQLGKDKNYLRYCAISLLNVLGGIAAVRIIFRYLDSALVPAAGFDALFDKYKPTLVFATDMQDLRVQEISDTYLVRAAKRRGIFSVGMSRSWDSMTTKGLLRTLPEVLVVQTEDIKRQAALYHSIPEEKIIVVGVPHYDQYITGKRMPREEFFRSLSLDPKRKLVFFAPPSDIWTGDKSMNPYFLKLLAELEEQVVVRFPIFGELNTGGFTPPAYMVFDRPANSGKLEEALLSRHDDAHFADLLYHSDVVVTGPSSVILDAAIFGKPIVLIGFDGQTVKPYWQRLSRYYDYEHQEAAIKMAGVKIAKNSDELKFYIRGGLEHPEQGAERRRQLAESSCRQLDGKSGERLADLLLNS